MAIGRIQRSKTTLYPLITFVTLFVIATVIAVSFYLKSEGHRKTAEKLQSQTDELATASELRNIPALVGSRQGRESRISTLLGYVDTTTSLILGGVPEETSAEVKVESVEREVITTLAKLAASGVEIADANTAGLVPLIEKLRIKLDETTESQQALENQLENLQKKFDDAMAAGLEKEQMMQTEKGKLQEQVDTIEQNYNEIKALMEKTTAQQVQMLATDLDQTQEENRKLNQSLLKTQAELKMAEEKMQQVQKEMAKFISPDIEVAARKADGRILLIDDKNRIVHLDIGRDDRVYEGLTFSVYERNMPIPKDGKGKAEIEVIQVGKNISTARIIRSEINRPIIVEDTVANLVWDRAKINLFVIAGDFDLDADGHIDSNADYRIKTLVEKWGGNVAEDISVDTDFLVLGKAPQILRKPTFEELEMDPMAMDKYDSSVQRLTRYKQVQSRAQALSIPIFNYDRFLYLIGYKTQSAKPGAF